MSPVAILLSTYNGELFLEEQIDSILAQTFSDFVLYIRDDGSTDSTKEIIRRYLETNPRVRLLDDEQGNIGVRKSFELLLELVEAPYYLFADQDDIWYSTKLEELYAFMIRKETHNEPTLVFSNMEIHNETQQVSYDFFQRYKVTQEKLDQGLFRGTISGCLMMFNHSCKAKWKEIEHGEELLHDGQVFFTTYLYGRIYLFPKKLINHRIHSNNVLGDPLGGERKFILLKDFAKFVFKSEAYRDIILSSYFNYRNAIAVKLDKGLIQKKELYARDEISQLGYFRRKSWYVKHFNIFLDGYLNGFIKWLTF